LVEGKPREKKADAGRSFFIGWEKETRPTHQSQSGPTQTPNSVTTKFDRLELNLLKKNKLAKSTITKENPGKTQENPVKLCNNPVKPSKTQYNPLKLGYTS